MYKLIILPLAKNDIKEAAKWYNSRQKGLGKRFTNEVRLKLNTLKPNPYINEVRYDEIRTSVFEVFPFMAHYSINEKQKLVIISAVLHTSRDPNIWSEREK
jgi:plasmid stabilization system protein ParE